VGVAEQVLGGVAVTVRRILAGTDDGQGATTQAIAQPPGALGWFGPDSAVWQVHGSTACFLGGIRALLVQALHPVALAGVTRYSSFRDDPFGRLQRTGAFVAATTFGSVELAERTCAAITRIHDRVAGEAVDAHGRVVYYRASDPDLLLWVHVGLVEGMLTAYEQFGASGPLDADRYVAEMAVVGRAMGVLDPPTSREGLTGVLEEFRPELAGGPELAQVRGFVMRPPMGGLPLVGYQALARAAEDGLPDWARTVLGSPVRNGAALAANRHAATVLLRTLDVALVESPSRAAARQRLGLVDR
jgi:uncharacterized protein (DUF2236 family)